MPPRPVPKIETLPPLPIGESGAPGVERIVALANNEISEKPSAAVLAACAAATVDANRYPDVGLKSLRTKIAETHGGLDPDRVVCGIGSSELIGLLAQAYCGPGDETIIGRQGYLFFGIATKAAGASPVHVGSETLGNRPGFDLDAALEAVTPATRIVFLDNPSNPLGSIVTSDRLRAFRAALREDILLVLDAAYADYVTDPDFEAGEELVAETENTVTLRTFSKIHGLAGLRVGWGYFPKAIAEVMRRVQRPGNITQAAIAGAESSLGETDEVAARRERNARIRDAFSARLAAIRGLSVLPSHTNFVFVTVDPDRVGAAALFEGAKARGVLLRPMGPYGQPDSLRISIGTEEEMAIAGDVIAEVMG
jgi:histidinol-phosphate aminotransferase